MKLKFSTWLNYLEEQYGDRPAVTGANTLTYYELINHSRRCAMTLNMVGVKKGDRVALWAANGTDWIISFFGIVMSGGIAILMNYGQNSEDTVRQLKMVEARWVIIGNNRISASNSDSAIRTAVRGGVIREHVLNMNNLMKVAMDYNKPVDMKAFYELDSGIYTRDTQLIVFNSENTAAAKAVELSSFSVLSNITSVTTLLTRDMTEKICDAMPLYNSFGLMIMLSWLHMGNRVYLLSSIKPQDVMDVLYKNNITGIASVGAIYNGLLRLPDFEEKLSPLLKSCIVIDGFTTPTEMMRFENSLQDGKFLIGYGQAECSAIISLSVSMDPLECRAYSVGRILPGQNLKIWDDGFLNPGEIGEIIIKCPNKMNGYYGISKEEQPFDADGWLHSGDLGMIDEFGLLELTGRIKDIIMRDGERISPIEIENELARHPSVREAKVFGAPHPLWGESVEACVVPEGDDFDPEALQDYLWKCLPGSKIPSHFFKYNEFPLNLNGRLDLTKLKADMLKKMRNMSMADILDDGIELLNLKVGNRALSIAPVCDMVQGFTELLSYKRKQVNRIRLAVEEMLTERVENAYDNEGDITLEVILMPEWLRIKFTDSGNVYRLDGDNASLSAKIILANVDAYSSVINEDDLMAYNLDWKYPESFNMDKFLQQENKD